MEETEATEYVNAVRVSAERLLEESLGGKVRLGEHEQLGGTRSRSRVLRCPLLEAPKGGPESVIIKCLRGESEETQETEAKAIADRTTNEGAANRFLNDLPIDPPISARFFGVDTELNFVVLQDFGADESLADVLTGEDPVRAREGLLRYATGMGRLHAATVGREENYLRLRAGIGAPSPESNPRSGNWLAENVANYRLGFESLDLALPAGFEEETRSIAAEIDDPGPFLAFAPGDTCPDNHCFLPDGIRFFDFEFCEFRHALLDGVYLLVPFPTCWCVNRLPDGLPEEALDAYRAELVKGCPEAAEDALFDRAAMKAHAYWMISTLGWNFEGPLKEDNRWGISSIRQRCLLRPDTFVKAAERTGQLPAIAETAGALAAKFRELWGPDAEMPLYPPFR